MRKLFLFSMLLSITLPINAGVRCSDFNTQEEAQRYYENHHAYHLDRDRDGEACECLPGGSKYGSSHCKKY